MRMCMLTTIDNPYDPFDKYDDWYRYDMLYGYNCCAYLDRIAKTSDALSEQENIDAIERAIDEIIELNPSNVYVKLVREV